MISQLSWEYVRERITDGGMAKLGRNSRNGHIAIVPLLIFTQRALQETFNSNTQRKSVRNKCVYHITISRYESIFFITLFF